MHCDASRSLDWLYGFKTCAHGIVAMRCINLQLALTLLLWLLLFLLQRLKYELQQERWSPIPSLRRHRHRNCPRVSPDLSETQQDPPSCLESRVDDDDDDVVDRPISSGADVHIPGYLPFRMHAAVPQFTRPVDVRRSFCRPHLPCARRRAGHRRQGVDAFHRRQKMLRTLRKRTAELTKALPTFMEVNRIDRMSRFVFPSLFVLFNVTYGSFYSIRWCTRKRLGFDLHIDPNELFPLSRIRSQVLLTS